MDEACRNTCEYIEPKVGHVTHLVLYIVAKDPEKQHVSSKVHPATM